MTHPMGENKLDNALIGASIASRHVGEDNYRAIPVVEVTFGRLVSQRPDEDFVAVQRERLANLSFRETDRPMIPTDFPWSLIVHSLYSVPQEKTGCARRGAGKHAEKRIVQLHKKLWDSGRPDWIPACAGMTESP